MAKNKYRMLISFVTNVNGDDELEAHQAATHVFYFHLKDKLENLHIEVLRKIELPVEVPAPEPEPIIAEVGTFGSFVADPESKPEVIPVTVADDIPF